MRQCFMLVFTIALGAAIAIPAAGQTSMKIPDSQQPPSSMRYVPLQELMYAGQDVPARKATSPPMQKAALPGDAVLVGTMINAYTSQGMFTTQLGYDWENKVLVTLYRAGPIEQYPNAGNGSLVLNVSTDGGFTWSGNSPIFNEDLPGNIQGMELSARHPSIFAFPSESGTSIATIWSDFHATLVTPSGILGEVAYKAGPLGGPYIGGRLDKQDAMQFIPARIVADKYGTLYSFFQSINPDQDMLTGEYFLMKSIDNGVSWLLNYTNPILREEDLDDAFQTFYSASKLDVSPDGTTLYLAFIGIYVDGGVIRFNDNRLGYVHSTDGGATWSDPVMYPLFMWDILDGQTVNTLDGWMLPSIGLAVDGLNSAHILISVNGGDTFFPLDSTLVGEITLNPNDPSEPPTFFKLAINTLPDFRRMVNPRNAVSYAQPTFSIFGEHDWCKAPDGMHLIAKWIDADSIFVTSPDGHPEPLVRDSTHDVYILEKDVYNSGNKYRGWETMTSQGEEVFRIVNITQSPNVDEKFSRISPFYDPLSGKTYFLYTIMGTGEFVPGQVYPDCDDLAPAELYIVPTPVNIVQPIGVESTDKPHAFSLAQNYPNPFTASTGIQFTLSYPANVRISIHDLLGREVMTVLDGFHEAGTHTVDVTSGRLPAGQYVYRMETGGKAVARLMSVLR